MNMDRYIGVAQCIANSKQLLETPLSWTMAQFYLKQSAGKSLNYDDTYNMMNNSEE
jgi:hypothetical protein